MINVSDKDKKCCCGCGACAQICPTNSITMKYDEEGFVYPYVNKKTCIDCGKCEKVCPFINIRKNKNEIEVVGAINKEEKIRKQSSSGGMFFKLSHAILQQNGIVCGVVLSDNCNNAKHMLIKSEEDLKKMQGSKYIQSETGQVYKKIKEYLEENKKVLFSGTTCQVAGLKNYLGKDYDNLLSVDLVCHGVPSTKLWNLYVKYIEKKYNSEIKEVYFRNKKYGWKDYGIRISLKNGKEIFQIHFMNPFFKMFNSDLCLRPSCYDCKVKGRNNCSDITLGDFWNIEKVEPKIDDNKGISLVLLNTTKGKDFFTKYCGDSINKISNLNYDVACKCNPPICSSTNKSEKREQFYKDIDKLQFEELARKYVPITKKERIKSILLKLRLWTVITNLRNKKS